MLDDLKTQIAEGLTSQSLKTCSRWASKRRIMGGDFAGPYSWKYHPWVKEMHDSTAPWNVAMKGAQLGVTEVGINRALYVIDILKRNVLYVLPTSGVASDFSKARFGTALRHSPYLASIFTDTNTVSLKQAGAVNLYIRGSRGESNLVSIDVSELILDEVDRMDQKEVVLALERLSGQLRKSIFALSTPTIPNYGVHKLFKDTTQDHFVFECPSCSRYVDLTWPDSIEIVGEHISDPRCRETFLKCKLCGAKLPHESKPEWLSTGRWKSQNHESSRDNRGFYINQLYSFTVSPSEIAVAHFRGFGDESARQELFNSKLGLPFVGDGAQIDDSLLDAAVEAGGHSLDDARPASSGRLITMGVDQGKWSYYEVCEWFVDDLSADLNAGARCKVLDQGRFYEDEWHRLDELMTEWQVLACVMDADPETNEARRFARRFEGFVWLCRYREGKVGKEVTISEEHAGAPIATVDRTNWMDASLGRFRSKRIALPRDVSRQYREHLKAPVRTYKRDDHNNPFAVYVETGADHYAHARTYAEIALPFAASITTGRNIERFL